MKNPTPPMTNLFCFKIKTIKNIFFSNVLVLVFLSSISHPALSQSSRSSQLASLTILEFKSAEEFSKCHGRLEFMRDNYLRFNQAEMAASIELYINDAYKPIELALINSNYVTKSNYDLTKQTTRVMILSQINNGSITVQQFNAAGVECVNRTTSVFNKLNN